MAKRSTPNASARRQTPSMLVKQAKLGIYLKQIAKALSDERGVEDEKKKFTMSSQALVEVELLIEHAIHNVAHNTGAILKYSDEGTIKLKAVQTATSLAFSGLLRQEVTDAGQAALDAYEASVSVAVA